MAQPHPTATAALSLNTDIGEGYGAWVIADDEVLLGLVTDANLACGFHASDPDIMRRTCQTARQRSVAIGAQVGFRDVIGFGRRFIQVPRATLSNDVLYQLGALSAFASAEQAPITFVKVHGALYHAAVQHESYARAIIDAVRDFDPDLPVLCQPGTAFWRAVQDAGLSTVAEGYLDRAYTAEGLLVPRGEPGAVITDPQAAARRAVQFATERTVTAIDGTVLDMPVASVCVHSDSPGASALAAAAREALEEAGVALRSLSGKVAVGG
ncbi:LamB/YcsF family protein [Saccharopolyspora spinosa]|uniref:UPF0271 protein n=1 Tax=Saccharopolyspora spinosa TaxID=60894 RepID=A0A2N3XZR9_SACSN|nr:5-oxoprolinase subunit PxpA [Saccharopolyspora spinosa]PKW16168.1 UPF0271 protein [Saccharopolyspora spinosa]